MERNAIIATVLVIAILLGYQWYLAQFEAPVQAPAPAPEKTQPPALPTPPAGAAVSPERPAPRPGTPSRKLTYTPTAQRGLKPQDVVVDTPLMRVVLSTQGARARSWQLKTYHYDDNGTPVDLVALGQPPGVGALTAWADPEQVSGTFEASAKELQLTGDKRSGSVLFTHIASSGLRLEKEVTFHADRYDVDVLLRVKNLAPEASPAQLRLAWGPGLRNSLDAKHNTLQAPTVWLNGERKQVDLQECVKYFLFFCSESRLNAGERTYAGDPSWVALQDNYFAAILAKGAKDQSAFVRVEENQPIVGLAVDKLTLGPGEEATTSVLVFAGPKDLQILKNMGNDAAHVVDLGMFDTVYLVTGALWLLNLFYGFTGNYGVAIILITILQKIAFHPLTVKSMRSMQAMQAVQPRVQAIQERYKNNPQKKQEEMMALYRKHGVNPMGGCLPMLVQIPIFIALYNALSSSVEMWQASFLWISDLTKPDSLFTVRLWGDEPYNVGNILGLLMGASMWLQQKMSPPAGDPRQAQMMLWMMPIIFTWMFWSFPSGLVLYWLVNNILQIGQQWHIMRKPARPATEGQAA
jgi:YidC/Oxa1 family membrane protein insertase